jgi:hypothetical protein
VEFWGGGESRRAEGMGQRAESRGYDTEIRPNEKGQKRLSRS